jgi:hypothetical protein
MNQGGFAPMGKIPVQQCAETLYFGREFTPKLKLQVGRHRVAFRFLPV